jgi:hypothetical protein
MSTRDIIQGADPEVSPKKKVYEDKIKYLETELSKHQEEEIDVSDFFTFLKDTLGDRLDMYMSNLTRKDQLPEWISDHYDESPTCDWLANSPYENVALLNWISYSDEEKTRILDDELADYFEN